MATRLFEHNKTLLALTAADAGTVLGDKQSKGLRGKVSVSTKGVLSIAFSYRYRAANGKTRDFGCGTWPATELALVRKARNDAAELVRIGKDPIDERDAAKAKVKAEAAKAKPLTVRALFDKWHAAALQDRKDKGAEPLRALTKDVFPVFGNQPAASVTKGKYLEHLDAITKRAPAQANTVYSYLNNMYAWAANRELVPVNPLAAITRDDVGGPDGERDRVLPAAELAELHGKLDSAALPDAVRHALMVLLGTAARSGELLRARKADITLAADLSGGTWDIPAENSKNKKPHHIVLSAWAAWHMNALLALSAARGGPWLMPDPADPLKHAHAQTLVNATADRQLKYYKRQTEGRSLNYAHALEVGGERWTPHDMRRSAATLMGELGIQPDVIDKCQNHTIRDKVRRTYQRQILATQQEDAWHVLGERLQELLPIK